MAVFWLSRTNLSHEKTSAGSYGGRGYEVYEAADGQTAIATLDQSECDLVLTDLKMPGMDGLGLLRHIHERLPQTFVVLMTAHASVHTAVEALRLGAQDYLLKPLVFEEVLSKVQFLHKHKKLAVENQLLR